MVRPLLIFSLSLKVFAVLHILKEKQIWQWKKNILDFSKPEPVLWWTVSPLFLTYNKCCISSVMDSVIWFLILDSQTSTCCWQTAAISQFYTLITPGMLLKTTDVSLVQWGFGAPQTWAIRGVLLMVTGNRKEDTASWMCVRLDMRACGGGWGERARESKRERRGSLHDYACSFITLSIHLWVNVSTDMYVHIYWCVQMYKYKYMYIYMSMHRQMYIQCRYTVCQHIICSKMTGIVGFWYPELAWLKMSPHHNSSPPPNPPIAINSS